MRDKTWTLGALKIATNYEDDRIECVTFMLKPALALVSINMTLTSRALASASSIETCLQHIK